MCALCVDVKLDTRAYADGCWCHACLLPGLHTGILSDMRTCKQANALQWLITTCMHVPSAERNMAKAQNHIQ